MYKEEWLIDIIKNHTSPQYRDVNLAEETIADWVQLPLITPKIYVGHLGIKLQYPESIWADAYSEHDNQEMLITTIQVLCKRADYPEVRTNIKTAYTGKTPFPEDANYSNLAFVEHSVVAKTGNKLHFQEVVGLIMPQLA